MRVAAVQLVGDVARPPGPAEAVVGANALEIAGVVVRVGARVGLELEDDLWPAWAIESLSADINLNVLKDTLTIIAFLSL